MTDLHWALLAIAGVLLLAIWIYSKWQERRALARLDAAMRQGVGDPLLGTRSGARRRQFRPGVSSLASTSTAATGNDVATGLQSSTPGAEPGGRRGG